METTWVLHCSWLPVKNKLRVARQHHLQTLLLPRLLDPTTGCRTNYTDTKLMKRQRNKCGWFCWIYKGFSIKLETTLGSDMELHGCKMFLHTFCEATKWCIRSNTYCCWSHTQVVCSWLHFLYYLKTQRGVIKKQNYQPQVNSQVSSRQNLKHLRKTSGTVFYVPPVCCINKLQR